MRRSGFLLAALLFCFPILLMAQPLSNDPASFFARIPFSALLYLIAALSYFGTKLIPVDGKPNLAIIAAIGVVLTIGCMYIFPALVWDQAFTLILGALSGTWIDQAIKAIQDK